MFYFSKGLLINDIFENGCPLILHRTLIFDTPLNKCSFKGPAHLILHKRFFLDQKKTFFSFWWFSELRRSWVLRFSGIFCFDWNFGDLIRILTNLTWISQFWYQIQVSVTIFEPKLWKSQKIDRIFLRKSIKFVMKLVFCVSVNCVSTFRMV